MAKSTCSPGAVYIDIHAKKVHLTRSCIQTYTYMHECVVVLVGKNSISFLKDRVTRNLLPVYVDERENYVVLP